MIQVLLYMYGKKINVIQRNGRLCQVYIDGETMPIRGICTLNVLYCMTRSYHQTEIYTLSPIFIVMKI